MESLNAIQEAMENATVEVRVSDLRALFEALEAARKVAANAASIEVYNDAWQTNVMACFGCHRLQPKSSKKPIQHDPGCFAFESARIVQEQMQKGAMEENYRATLAFMAAWRADLQADCV